MSLPPDLAIARLDSDSSLHLLGHGYEAQKLLGDESLQLPNSDVPRLTLSRNSYKNQLFEVIKSKLESWVDELGSHSAQAQGLKESITSYSKFIRGSFRPHSPHKNADSIYFLIRLTTINGITDPVALGFVRIGCRNLFFENQGQLVNVPQCISILGRYLMYFSTKSRKLIVLALSDFYLSQQRQGFGYLLLSHVLSEKSICIDQCAFDRPTSAMLSFLSKHFNLKRPREQHNRFVIFDEFFRLED